MGLFKRPGSKKWWMRFYHDGKLIAMSTKTENEKIAKKKFDVIKGEIAKGTYKHIGQNEQITLERYAKEFFLPWAETNLKPKSYHRYKVSLNQLLPFFGKSKLRKIHHRQLEKYRETRGQSVSQTTINRDFACLKSLFSHAMNDNYCEENPVKKIRFHKEAMKAFFYLTENEARNLLGACDAAHIKTFVLLGLNTGMRTQEMLKLTWADISFDDRTILIRDSKSGNDDCISMSDAVSSYLTALERHSDFVVSSSRMRQYKDVRKAWNRVVNKAGIADKKCTPHILRHTFAITLVRNGVDLLTVKELGRWSDLKLVQRYAHVSKSYRTRIVNKLGERFGGDTKGDTVSK